MKHPARVMDFDSLWTGLIDAKNKGFVRHTTDDDGLSLFCYSEACTYEKAWNEHTLIARGIILDEKERKVVATPFPKFFNVSEREQTIPDLPFETFEKLDGSLIIIFHHNGKWKTATKGSFKSDQAKWAANKLAGNEHFLTKGTTYLCEAIYPENRIVVHYPFEGLVLLSAYDQEGIELPFYQLRLLNRQLGWSIANRWNYSSVSELLEKAKTLPSTEEGFVLRFSNGHRLKVKGDEYCRIHRIISRVTPLAMWEAMYNKDDLVDIRKQLPEEFWEDFDNIIRILEESINAILKQVRDVAEPLKEKTDKEVGLCLSSYPENVRRFIFPYRNNNGDLLNGKPRDLLFRTVRPTGNNLGGYRPSTSINRVVKESS